MSSWAGKGAATRVHSPDFDADFAVLDGKIQRQIESKLDDMGMRLADYPHYRLTGSSEFRFRVVVGRRDKIYKRRNV